MNETIGSATPEQVLEKIPTQMKAAVLSAPGRITFQQVALPECGKDQALVKLEGCGLCASSNPLWEGREWFQYPQPPGAPGHEGWGRVVKAGAASRFDVGQRVATLSGNAFAEYVAVNNDQAVAIPSSIDHLPFPGEPLGCVMNVLDRSRLEPGHTVAVIGMGFIGLLVAKLASARGAKVIALSRRQPALDRVKGASHRIISEDQWAAIREVMAITREKGVDRVIECTGFQVPLNIATDIVAEGGMIVIAGYHQDGLRQVDLQKWNWKGIDVVNAHERAPERYIRGIDEAAHRIARGEFDPRDLLSHRFPFDQLEQAMELTNSNDDELIKAYVEFR